MKAGYAVVIMLIVAMGAWAVWSNPTSKNPQTDSVSISGLSLCSANCIYPAPHSTAMIIFNGSAVLQDFMIYVNGTTLTTYVNSGNLTYWALWWKGGVPSSMMPVVKGDAYSFSIVAHFDDGTTATANATTVAL